MSFVPQPTDVVAAAKRLAGHAVVTPLLRSPELDARSGGRILLKAECLQLGGAFKFRGAYNRLAQLSEEEKRHGVVAWSSGNHAQGVAAAAKLLGVRASIIIPADAPAIKVENTRRLGAEIIFYDRHREDREAIGRALAQDRGCVLVPSYDDPHIIAGQGTAALEMIEQARTIHGASLDALIAPCSGGGLLSGCVLALQHASPQTKVFSAEPEAFDDLARSLDAGERQSTRPGSRSICDALQAPRTGDLTFPILRKSLAGGLRITDELALAAMRFAWRELKLVLEPSGAVGLAVVLAGQIDCRDQTIGVVLSGGNVDATLYREMLEGG